jgi:acetolactate synthase I/II/III large subunit
MRLADYVVRRVVQEGTKHVALVPGGGAMHLNDAVAQCPDLGFVANLHEHACAVGAEAYAKTAGRLGVAMVTSGPGSTNCITGVASAWVNSAPTLFLSGQVKRADLAAGKNIRQLGPQEIDIVSIVKPITKYASTLLEPNDVRKELDRALYLAQSGRPGPVWLAIPLDVQAAVIDPEKLAPWDGQRLSLPSVSRDQVRQVANLLRSAERPVILAGGGIWQSGTEQAFRAVADRLGVPIQLSWNAIDLLPDDHPFYAGRPGAFASRWANFTVQNADCLVTLGLRWEPTTTGFNAPNLARAARRVAVDVDASELAKMPFLDLAIHADLKDFLACLLEEVPAPLPPKEAWLERCRDWRQRYPVVTEEHRRRQGHPSVYALMEMLGKFLESDDVVVQGSAGLQSEVFFLTFQVKKGQRILCDASYGSMGYGLPAAIGACIASGRRTILVDGDGSFLPNVQELETVRRLQLPLKMVVVNNAGYGSIRASQQRWFTKMIAADERSGLSITPIRRLADGYQLPFFGVEDASRLESTLREMLALPGPALLDVRVPDDEERVPRLQNFQRPDGSMASKPIEDLYPFLDRQEFKANMLIPPLEE